MNSRACEYPAKRSGARLYGMSGETAARAAADSIGLTAGE
ncbi:hypothetical protein C7S14_1381 [Burkholderia cepacia]|nr:hypothetical protein [Burkholderia cepacia]QOH39869.1 hypothetical protein C7S14_1381 [Burkholderia cepacia]